MKKLLVLTAVALLTASTVGCAACRRARTWWNQGAACTQPVVSTVAPQMVTPTIVGSPPCCETDCCETAPVMTYDEFPPGTVIETVPGRPGPLN